MPTINTDLLSEKDKSLLDALRSRSLNDDDASTIESMTLLPAGRDLPPLPDTFNPEYLAAVFGPRPLTCLTRILQIGGTLLPVLPSLVGAAVAGSLSSPATQASLAAEFREALTTLGPFFIKAGQALSIRPDILPPAGMVEMQKLCDKVPSYPSDLAFSILEEELGGPKEEFFSEITPEPVAAASLGQVYRARLKDGGGEVAVKVQRPEVLETVSLDLHLVRSFGLALNKINPNSGVDVVSLLDEFGGRFYDELDYVKECDNGLRVYSDFKNAKNVKIPFPYSDLCSRRVHTAEWCEGEKLSQSSASDVGALVNLGVTVYLEMLLSSGFFHADPHPGNMLRSPEGELVILDFGLMTSVSPTARDGMVAAIVHLLRRDYSMIGDDFKDLEFIPPEVDTAPIVPALKRVFDAALSGGGAKSINFQEVSADLAEITFDYDFRLPPYFALIIRAIAVLEGIALVGNPSFAIIDEAFPWIARRLLTDGSEKTREALKFLVYGKDGEFDGDRMVDVLVALEKYNSITTEGDGTAFKQGGVRGKENLGDVAGSVRGTRELDGGQVALSEAAGAGDSDDAGKEALRFFFSEDGGFFREFMLDEVASSVDALSRGALYEIGKSLGVSPEALIPGGNSLLLPGVGLLASFNPPLTPTDEKNVKEVLKLLSFLRGRGGGTAGVRESILPVVREFRTEVAEFGVRVVMRLSEKRVARGLKFLAGSVPAPRVTKTT